MCDRDSRIVRAEEFAKIWWKSRADAGKSQEYLALGLGVSRKTVQNWERGLSAPDLFQAVEWFRLLDLNPTKYFLEFLYPNFFEPKTADDEADLEEKLITLIKNSSVFEKKELLYLMTEAHGSSWQALLQLGIMHCQTSLQARTAAARTVLENYEIEEKTGNLVGKNKVKPNVELLKTAICQCKAAAQSGKSSYLTVLRSTDAPSSSTSEN